MCGFSGEIDFTRSAADPVAVACMTGTMAARGPDGSGLWAQGPVALGHRRLKVIDLSERAAQPMVDAELGVSVVFNGCIYNHRELRRELESAGYRFFSTGDTEVIVKAYHHWGDGFVEHLTGMFALCLVERDAGRVVLARDRLGVKPLYLAEVGRSLRFASTLPALLAAGGVDTSIDPVALHQYLTFHSVVPAPRTILRGVRKLPPATLLAIEPDGSRRETTWWRADFSRRPEHEGWSPRDWQDAILGALRTAVDRRRVADVPVGCLLSGGLDSSLVVGLLAEAGASDLLTFSIGFESHGGIEGDEFRWSDLIARRFATDHHRIRIGGDR
ncbi:MAG TPA: asparagine synthase (glutamine-hydrolyzing), partial [Acidimicrobiales bacterium]